MKNRNQRDTARRNYIKQRTEENLKFTKNDPQSLFAK
jgi:hypothetical protein